MRIWTGHLIRHSTLVIRHSLSASPCHPYPFEYDPQTDHVLAHIPEHLGQCETGGGTSGVHPAAADLFRAGGQAFKHQKGRDEGEGQVFAGQLQPRRAHDKGGTDRQEQPSAPRGQPRPITQPRPECGKWNRQTKQPGGNPAHAGNQAPGARKHPGKKCIDVLRPDAVGLAGFDTLRVLHRGFYLGKPLPLRDQTRHAELQGRFQKKGDFSFHRPRLLCKDFTTHQEGCAPENKSGQNRQPPLRCRKTNHGKKKQRKRRLAALFPRGLVSIRVSLPFRRRGSDPCWSEPDCGFPHSANCQPGQQDEL